MPTDISIFIYKFNNLNLAVFQFSYKLVNSIALFKEPARGSLVLPVGFLPSILFFWAPVITVIISNGVIFKGMLCCLWS